MAIFNKDDLINTLHRRASTRSYDGNKKIPADELNAILELGRLSPSSVGSEPCPNSSVSPPLKNGRIAIIGILSIVKNW